MKQVSHSVLFGGEWTEHVGPRDECLEPGCYLPAERPIEFGQAAPIPNDQPSCHDLVIRDMAARKAFGLAKYSTLLQPLNGRDMLQDAYEEALDLAVYLRGLIEERRLGTVIAPERRLGTEIPPADGPYFTAADLALHLETGRPVVPSGVRRTLIAPDDSVTSD